METDQKKKSPYSGLWIILLILIGVPFGLFIFIYCVILERGYLGKQLALYTSLVFGYGLGFLFQIGCAIAGLFKGTFSVVIKRIREFFDDLIVSTKYAVKSYFRNFIEDGFSFWIYLTVILATFGIFVFGIIKYFSIM
jgi:hypothetical protein